MVSVEPVSVREVLGEGVVWDNHSCLPLRPADQSFLPLLDGVRAAGVDVLTLNAACGPQPLAAAVAMITAVREWVLDHPEDYALVESTIDIAEARRSNRLGICFDVEGMDVLENSVSNVDILYDLGVRWMLATYNMTNSAGGGCLADDRGLTSFGRAVLERMNARGMVVCASHCGHRTAMDLMACSRAPVIFSHSNPRAMFDHPRNIPDDLIRRCAAGGGVVGINGFGPFLGPTADLCETFADHLHYVLDLVGDDHVGIGLDFVFDRVELDLWLEASPDMFPPHLYPQGAVMAAPADLGRIASILLARGIPVESLRKIFGGNLLRVAESTWGPAEHADRRASDRGGGDPLCSSLVGQPA